MKEAVDPIVQLAAFRVGGAHEHYIRRKCFGFIGACRLLRKMKVGVVAEPDKRRSRGAGRNYVANDRALGACVQVILRNRRAEPAVGV